MRVLKMATPDEMRSAERLTGLEVDEVSLVDAAANKRKFLVVKRRDKDAAPGEDGMSQEGKDKEKEGVDKAEGTDGTEEENKAEGSEGASDVEKQEGGDASGSEEGAKEGEGSEEPGEKEEGDAEDVEKAKSITPGRINTLRSLHTQLGDALADWDNNASTEGGSGTTDVEKSEESDVEKLTAVVQKNSETLGQILELMKSREAKEQELQKAREKAAEDAKKKGTRGVSKSEGGEGSGQKVETRKSTKSLFGDVFGLTPK